MAGISGVSGAGPIFHRTMLALHEGQHPTFPKQPATLARISIDERTGHRFLISPAQNTPFQRRELCFKNHLPLPISPINFTKENKALLSLEYAEWFKSEDNTKRHAFALADSKPPLQESLQILTPLPNATYYLDPELPGIPPSSSSKQTSPTATGSATPSASKTESPNSPPVSTPSPWSTPTPAKKSPASFKWNHSKILSFREILQTQN